MIIENKTFKEEDLKDGMVVETREGKRYMVLDNCFINHEDKHISLDNYLNFPVKNNNGQTDKIDIVKIYKADALELKDLFDNLFLELIWEEKEIKEKIDWSKIPVDTKILVSSDCKNWNRRYFAKFKNDEVYAWGEGGTSFTKGYNNDCRVWKFAKLYESQDE